MTYAQTVSVTVTIPEIGRELLYLLDPEGTSLTHFSRAIPAV